MVWNAKNCTNFTSSRTPFYSVSSDNFDLRSQITSFIFGDSVQHIPAYICNGMNNLTAITIPNSVTSVGGCAFKGCSGLTSVVWNAKNCADFTYDNYGQVSFDLCSQITSFVFGDSVQHIPACICDGMNNLTAITIPNSVTSIGGSAFSGCSGLTSVTIPNSVTSIGNEAFYDCSGLTSITIPNNITSIGVGAFRDCGGLTSVVWNVKNYADFTDGYTPFYFTHYNSFDLRSQITSFVFGDSVQHIPAYICSGMKNLASVTIPNSVTSIGGSAFSSCSDLRSVTIGNSVTSIGGSAFSGCSGLTSVTIPNSVTSIGASAFNGCWHLTSVTIGKSVTNIGGSAFSGCNGLTSITIPNSVTSIGGGAFSGCSGLTSVVWKAKRCTGWNDYKSSPFYLESGNNITSFTFGKEVKSIPNYLCYEMKNLTSVVIPNSVESIGDEAFRNCRALISVTMGKNVTYIGYRAFDGTYWLNNQQDGLIYMNTVLYGYKGEMPQGTEVIVREGTTEIGDNAFADCIGLTSITIPKSVAYVGKGAFSECNNLTFVVWNAKHCECMGSFSSGSHIRSFTFGNEVESIPAYLCSYLYYLDSIIIPNSVTSIEKHAFSYCRGLTSVTIGNSVTSIGDMAFSDCSGLTSVTIGNSVTSIGDYAFDGCSGLTKTNYTGDISGWYNIDFGINANPIGYSRNFFVNDVLIKDLVIPEGIETINKTFAYDTCFVSVIIPNSVTSIGEYAFSGCSGLTSVTIPNSVTSIGGNEAFSGCTGLTYVTCYATEPPTVSGNAFYGVKVDTIPLYVPMESMTKYNSSNVWKDFLVLPISAMPVDVDEPVLEPEENKVTIT